MGEIQEFMSSSFGEQAPLMFNAAVPACDPFVMDYLVRLLSSQGITPGTVIMEISRETIQLGCPWMDSHLTRVMTWQDMPDALEDFIASRRISRLLSSRIIPIFLYRKELLTWIFDSSPPYLKAASADEAAPVKPAPGAQNNPKPQQADAVKISHSVPPHIAKSYRNYQIRGINPRHLESMLTFLHERNVAVILVGVPVCRDHLDCYSTEINQKFMDYIEYLTRAYGCSFVEYCDRIPNEFFVDDLHLNLTGAVSFTRMLASEVLHDAWINSGRCEEHGSPSIKRVGE